MVKYYGRARTRTGSVNTNQLGLKMSGCPSTVGKQGRIARYMGRRVDCMMGLCKPIRYHEVIWPRTRMRNQPPFCRAHATKCLAAAGGVGTNHNIPYYRIPKRGESGCTPTLITHPHHQGPGPSPTLTTFHLSTATIAMPASGNGEIIGFTGYDETITGYPAKGDLQPRKYNGVEISGIMTDNDKADNAGCLFIVIFRNSAVVPKFNNVTIVGGGA